MTKQLLLMMLFALMSVTGSWAINSFPQEGKALGEGGLEENKPDEGFAVLLNVRENDITLDNIRFRTTWESYSDGYTQINTKYRICSLWPETSMTTIESLNGCLITGIVLSIPSPNGEEIDMSKLEISGMKSYKMEKFQIEIEIEKCSSVTIKQKERCPDYDVTCVLISVLYIYPPHQHIYAVTWTTDADYHWHACTSTTGLCHEPQANKAAHSYDNQSTGAAYYTCQICQYHSENRHKELYAQEVQAAAAGSGSAIESVANNYIDLIRNAATLDEALALRNKAKEEIAVLIKYKDAMSEQYYIVPTEPGMRLRVEKTDGKIYEFSTSELRKVDYYRAIR